MVCMECILLEKTHFSELQHFAAILNEVQSGDIEASPRDCGFFVAFSAIQSPFILDLILTLFHVKSLLIDGKLCT